MIRAIIFDCFGVLYENGQINQELVRLIARLKPHYKIGLLSNADRVFLNRLLRENNLEHIFDAVVASSETGYAKPHREIFARIASNLAAEFYEIVFIDDYIGHVEAAEDYGITSILYQGPDKLRQKLGLLRISP